MEGRVLIIEDHRGNRTLISERLEQEGLAVAVARTGEAGIREAMRFIPQAILLSTSLPDLAGLEVARRLRQINRTKHVFLMLVGDEDNRRERLEGLEAGANDFVTNPIDPDLVMLRIRNAIHRANLENNTDPTTGMPAGRQVQDELVRLLRDARSEEQPGRDWALVRFRIRNLEPFREVYGFMAGDNLLQGTAQVLAESLAHDEVEDDFLGYGGHDDFIVITRQSRAAALVAEVTAQFDRDIGTYYGFLEREQGYIAYEGKRYPLAALRVRMVTPADGPFYDIRSLSEALAG